MNPQFLIAKLAANATSTAWSQAYSTLNFYVVLSVSIDEEGDKPVAQIGKELLERLQREYFSLDEKTIESIKKAVENTVNTVEKSARYSLVLVTNNENTLYIITAEEGIVSIKRNEKLGIVAEGHPDKVLSFTGPLQHNDIILIQTDAFAHKLSPLILNPHLQTDNLTEISEGIAPLLHDNPTGAEAIVLLQYINPENISNTVEEQPDEDNVTEENLPDADDYSDESITELLSDEKPHEKKFPIPIGGIPDLISKVITRIRAIKNKKRFVIGISIIVLLLFLIGSILIRTQQEKAADNTQAISQALQSAQTEYDEGEAIEPLNRPLALDKYTKAKDLLTQTKAKYPNDNNLGEVNALLAKVDSKLSQLSSGKRVENGQEITSAQDLKLDQIQTVTIKGGSLMVTDKANKLVTIDSSGEVDETYDLDTTTIMDITADSDSAYVLSNSGVIRVNLSNGNNTELFKIDKARTAIDVFGSNIYLLNSANKTVEKYSPSAYKVTEYLDSPLQNTPVSMGIDGSIYTVIDNGKVQKFTRGVDDTYNVTGTQGNISKNSLVYSAQDYTYVYILDRTNQRVLITSKNGEVKQEYSWDIIGKAVDFSADEASKTIYIATPEALHSFTF